MRVRGGGGEGRGGVCSAGVDDAGVVLMYMVLRNRVQKDVKVCAYMQVRVLECAGEGEYQRYVFLFIRLLPNDVHCCGRTGRESAGEGCIVMYVEF